jgi:hypothetical protein
MSKRYDIECREKDGILQWNDSGVLVACAEPRKEVTDQTNVLFRAKDDIEPFGGFYLSSNTEEKDRYIRYFTTIYPSTKQEIWRNMTVQQLQQVYENLEIWYNIGTNPGGKQTTRAAYKPFYRIPDGVNLQQNVNHKAFPKNCWAEVYHAGNLNTDFYIPSQFFSGTYYYPSRGSGVFLRLGKSLVAPNKVSALKMLRVPNDVIFQYSGKSFKRWLSREARYIKQTNPHLENDVILKQALDTQIEKMKNGKNSINVGKDGKDICYYGIGSEADSLLAFSALQKGYDTIQLFSESQLGCDTRGVLTGFEIIDLRTPDDSAQNLSMYVPEEYVSSVNGYYPDKQHRNSLQPSSSSTKKAIVSTTKASSTKSKISSTKSKISSTKSKISSTKETKETKETE